jgi:hypothetical protein
MNNSKIKSLLSSLNTDMDGKNACKVSENMLKQAQILDVEIVASLLGRKMRMVDPSNTIARLIK